MPQVDFDTWSEEQLKEFLIFNGKDVRSARGHFELSSLSKQTYGADSQTLDRFSRFIQGGGKVDTRCGYPAQPAYPPSQPTYPAPAYPAPAYGAPPYGAAQSSPYPAPAYNAASFPYGAAPPPAPAYAAPLYGASPAPTYSQPAYPPGPSTSAPAYPQSAYPPGPAASAPAYPPAASAPPYPAFPAPSKAGPAYPQPAQGKGNPPPSAATHYGQTPNAPAFIPAPLGPQLPHGALQQQAGQVRTQKALLIGCNYPGTSAELRGCVNDALCMDYLLKSKFGFKPENIRILRDDREGGRRPGNMPTHANILANIRWLVDGHQPGDSLFFHFSGHGSQKRDYKGEESDGMNETVCPCDFERAGQIVDDTLNSVLVRPIRQGATMHAVIDACHSGTALDLPFVTQQDKASRRLHWVQDGDPRRKGTSGGLAVQFGACKDSQTAADTNKLSQGTSTGAATFLFIQAVEKLSQQGAHNITYAQIIAQMWEEIIRVNGKPSAGKGLLSQLAGVAISAALGGGSGGAGGLLSALTGGGAVGGQTPQLSASSNFDLNLPMHL